MDWTQGVEAATSVVIVVVVTSSRPRGAKTYGQDRTQGVESWCERRRRFPDLSYGAEPRSGTLAFWTRCWPLTWEEYGCNLEEEWCYLACDQENLEERIWSKFW